jgi:hypothetical protein
VKHGKERTPMRKLIVPLIATAAALALHAVPAAATLKNVENAYEGDARSVTLPANGSGRVLIRECDRCKPVTLRVDAATRYFVGTSAAAPVTLKQLRDAAAADPAGTRLLTVFYSLETNVVTRIVLGAP